MTKTNLLVGLLIGLVAFSCSNDDNTDNPNPIIGNWRIESSKTFDLNENLLIEELLSDCKKRSTMTFSDDNNYSCSLFIQNTNGECIDLIQSISNGIWTFDSLNGYQISGLASFEGVITDLGQRYDEIILSNNRLTLRREIRFSDVFGNIIKRSILVEKYLRE